MDTDPLHQGSRVIRPEDYPMKRHPAYMVAAAMAATLVLGGVFALAYSQGWIMKDSGVKACESLAGGERTLSTNNDELTEAEYRQLRQVFADSRHDDIRDHGTKLMDLVWSVQQLGDEPGLGALSYYQPMTEHIEGLKSACADQGILVTFPPA